MALDRKPQLLIVAGEPSGDRAAANVATQLKQQGCTDLIGVGGDQMAEAGVQLVCHIHNQASVGVAESVRRLSFWMDMWHNLRHSANRLKPAVALLVDAPEFNLPLARVLSEAGTTVVYYVGPQVWAWRRHRLGLLKERTDVVALILPFEKPLYDRAGVNAVYVGHPLLDEPRPRNPRHIRRQLGMGPMDRLVAFLPGSRPGEVARHAGPMIESAEMLTQQGISCVFAPGPHSAAPKIIERAKAVGMQLPPPHVSGRNVLGAARAAIVASGTATLEAATLGTPLAIVYRVDGISWQLGQFLVKVPYVGLPNLIAGRGGIPELLQDQVTGPALFQQALKLLEPEENRRQKAIFAFIADQLGTAGAARQVASLVLDRLP